MASRCRFRWDLGKKSFPAIVVRPWNEFPREIVAAPSLEVSQGQVRWGLEQPGIVERDWERLILKIPFYSNHSRAVSGSQ